jgi:two-component system, chemotaxis family, chemotaxis protein CheY
MKILIAEDDFTSRLLLQELLKSYGLFHLAVNGKEAVEAVRLALEAGEPYHLICLDIMMPEMDGQQALVEIRQLEEIKGIPGQARAKIIMTTALADKANVMKASEHQCDYYLIKPYDRLKLQQALYKLNLIK